MKVKKLVLAILLVAVLFQIGCSCNSVTRFFGGEPQEVCKDHWEWREKAEVVQVELAIPEPAYTPCVAP